MCKGRTLVHYNSASMTSVRYGRNCRAVKIVWKGSYLSFTNLKATGGVPDLVLTICIILQFSGPSYGTLAIVDGPSGSAYYLLSWRLSKEPEHSWVVLPSQMVDALTGLLTPASYKPGSIDEIEKLHIFLFYQNLSGRPCRLNE